MMRRSLGRFAKPSADIAMPTPLSLGFDLVYHPAPSSSTPDSNSNRRPLAVIAGWMGAKERQLRPYVNFYHARGIDTLSFAVGPTHVLMPNTALTHMERVLSAAKNPQKGGKDRELAVTSGQELQKVIFHHFSVGGFLYGQMLRLISEKDAQHGDVQNLIRAQIFDSPPDFRGIAKGVSRSIGVGAPVSVAVELLLRGYLKATEGTSGVVHRKASEAFHNNHLTHAPSLWYYSKADPVADWKDCATVISKWQASGMHVEECVWDDTPHIQHARFDPERYFGTLDKFLVQAKVI